MYLTQCLKGKSLCEKMLVSSRSAAICEQFSVSWTVFSSTVSLLGVKPLLCSLTHHRRWYFISFATASSGLTTWFNLTIYIISKITTASLHILSSKFWSLFLRNLLSVSWHMKHNDLANGIVSDGCILLLQSLFLTNQNILAVSHTFFWKQEYHWLE